MTDIDKAMDYLKLKVEYSLEYGKLLDEQLNALDREDSVSLAESINKMDEYQARLRDVDRMIRKTGFGCFWENQAGSRLLQTNPFLMDICMQAREILLDNVEKIKRNRELVISKRDKIVSQMKDVSHSGLVRKYFDKAESGEFLNFSG